jgi:hypothetical protein
MMTLWEALLVLRARFEERSTRNDQLAATDDEELEAAVWGQAFKQLDELVVKYTRVKPGIVSDR